NSTSLPTDLSEATGINSVTGKFLSAKTRSILDPTNPVAPTTATFIFFLFFRRSSRRQTQKPSGMEGLLNFYAVTYITLQTFRLRRTVSYCVLYVSLSYRHKNRLATASVQIFPYKF